MEGNYIKLYRSFLEWEWYRNINTKVLFIHMLLKANWKEGRFEGIVIPRGSFISSIPKLSYETDLTQREVRTAIEHLKTTGELAVRSHNKYSVFTVNNYSLYQLNDIQGGIHTTDNRHSNDILTTDNRHSNDILTTTIEERKEKKEGKNGRKEEGKKEKNDITVSNETVCQTDVRLAVEMWNELEAYGIKPVSRLAAGSQRYQRLTARIKQYGMEAVTLAIGRIKNSSFLQGKNSKGWVITFDWFVMPNNFPKVLDGNYDGCRTQERSSGNPYMDAIRNRVNDVDNW